MTPKKQVPKNQPSISSFFSPKPAAIASPKGSQDPRNEKNEKNGKNGTAAKRSLEVFSHSPSKKPRKLSVSEGGENEAIFEKSGSSKDKIEPRDTKNTTQNSHASSRSAAAVDVEIVLDDEEMAFEPAKPAANSAAVPRKRKLDSFRNRISSKRTNSPALSSPAGTNSTKPAKPAKAKSGTAKLTPLEQQYIELKTAHKDKVLAIQVGYKYKFFGEDAVVASQLLNIMLIPGNLRLDERTHDRFGYCSIPDTRLHIHLQRLLNHGLKVGVVKQTESAAVRAVESTNKSGLFGRQITGVYTRATYMGEEAGTGSEKHENYENYTALDRAEPDHYVVCIDESGHFGQGETGIVAVQPATGEIIYDAFCDTAAREHLETRLAYLDPSEVLVLCAGSEAGSEAAPKAEVSPEVGVVLKLQNPNARVSCVQAKSLSDVKTALAEYFGPQSHLANYYTSSFPECVQRCVSELITYLSEFNLSNVFTLPDNVSSFTEAGRYMVLPAGTLRALDIFQVADDPGAKNGTLYSLVNHTRTRKGASMLRGWLAKPLVNRFEIEARLDAVGCLASGEFVHVLDSFKRVLAKIGRGSVDLDRAMIKVHYAASCGSDKISRKELYQAMRGFRDILEVFRGFGENGISELKRTFSHSQLIAQIMDALLAASTQKTVDEILDQIDAGATLGERDSLEQKTRFFNHRSSGKYAAIADEFDRIADVEAELESELHSLRAFLKRPQLAYVTNMKDTHLVEVRNGKAVDSLPRDWLRISATKTVSRFRPPNVARLHTQLQYHQERLVSACDACFRAFLQEIDSKYAYFREIVHNVARFDCLLSLASLVQENGPVSYVKPKLAAQQVVDIRQGCHPILSALAQNAGAYVPNDVRLSYDHNRVLLITGPNMGGKSSLVKQIALFAVMAQIGSFVPCTQATLGVFDAIHIRMGASDNILRGKSTFMVEMSECASIVQNYTSKSLVILDEIGRGTGTSDGISLAYAILKHLADDPQGPLALFITHYPSLHVLEHENALVRNYHMAFVEKRAGDEGAEHDWPEVVFLYKLVAGVAANSYGLNVAKLAGIDRSVIDAAHAVSRTMKADVERAEMLAALARLTPENAFEVLFDLA